MWPFNRELQEVPRLIQRPGNCPRCGYWDSFHASWYSPETEVAEARWLLENDPSLLEILLDHDYITVEHFDGDWVYHMAKKSRGKSISVYRWPVSIAKVGFGDQEKVKQ